MLKFLKDRVIDELTDAVIYMEKAVECKHHTCGQVFYNDAMQESEHANNMLKMFQKWEKPSSVTDAEYNTMKSEMLDAYAENMGKFEMLRKAYWS